MDVWSSFGKKYVKSEGVGVILVKNYFSLLVSISRNQTKLAESITDIALTALCKKIGKRLSNLKVIEITVIR